MKLFVDDERAMPADGGWIISRTGSGAIDTLQWVFENPPNRVDVLSLDHDLGDDSYSGYHVAAWLELQVHTANFVPPKVLKVHSANPVGRARILQAFQSIARFCEQNGMEIPKIEG